jgi:uncharacterized protein (TIGR03067 family)
MTTFSLPAFRFASRLSMAIALAFFALQVSGQEETLLTVKPGERYKVQRVPRVTSVAKDLKHVIELQKLRQTDEAMAIEYYRDNFHGLPNGTLVEITKVVEKSTEHPGGYVEARCTKFRGKPEIVYFDPVHLHADIMKLTLEENASPAFRNREPLYRKWKAAEGGFEVEAELVVNEPTRVVLQRKGDGKAITLTPDKLSPPDRQWLKELAALEGCWKTVSAEIFGKVVPANEQEIGFTVFERGRLAPVFEDGSIHEGAGGTIAVNPSASPKTIDLTNSDGSKVLGIYQLDKDQMILCLAMGGQPRPTAFKGFNYMITKMVRDKK